jgi:hypothetical protein
MADEFQTVSAKRGEALRTGYRRHREALMNLVSDAPTELLAAHYRRVIADIDIALAKIEGADVPPAQSVPPPPIRASSPRATDAGTRPLVTSSIDHDSTISDYGSDASDSRARLFLIAVAAILALGAIGWLIWRASDKTKTGTVVEQPSATTTTGDETPVTPIAPAAGRPLVVTPDSVDYGIVRKGTRVTRQYEIVNNSDEPLSPQVSRSTCRCLYYEHAPVIPPKAKESLTVTIDGAKAKVGPLLESIRITSKSEPSIVTTFDVTATVR